MGRSRNILTGLSASLEAYIDQLIEDDEMDAHIIYEHYRELPEDLENRNTITQARIAIFHEAEESIVRHGAEKPADSRQRLGLDINVLRAYRGDTDAYGELPALDIRDAVVDWAKQVDAFATTGGGMNSLAYDGAAGFIRRKRYITLTLRLSGLRDLLQKQISED